MLEPCAGKLARTVLKGESRRKPRDLPGPTIINRMKKNHIPPEAVRADKDQLSHINTYGELPDYYVDIRFLCVRCGCEDAWEARHQKLFFEKSKRHIDSQPTLCIDCRRIREKEKEISREQVKNRRNKGNG